MNSLVAGAFVDGYLLEENMYQGNMASIWKVARSDLTGPALMKIPSLRGGDDPAAIVGFEVECMVLPRLSGVHVPHFIGAGDFATQPYIVMEAISGKTLLTRIADTPLAVEEVADIGARVAVALHAVHIQQVIHLDLKPSNVMFRPDGNAVLIDFGLSRHDDLPDLLAEEFRLPIGTGPYISPEQILGIRNDPRSDLFALGVILYYLVTGRRPYGNPARVAGLRRRLYRDPLPPKVLNRRCPDWLQEVILCCLSVDPRQRYSSAAQVALLLHHPDQIAITERGRREGTDSFFHVLARRLRVAGMEASARQNAREQLAHAPILAVAVDLEQSTQGLHEAIRRTVTRILEFEPGARLACLTVRKTPRIGMDLNLDKEGRNLHVKGLVELRDWARPLTIAPGRITYHVLEGPEIASAIVDYASVNRVDHVVLGARGSSAMRRYLGSVSAQVVAEAPCSVTVVREPRSGTEQTDATAA